MFDVFEKIKNFFGGGSNPEPEEATKEEIAALVRAVAHGIEPQDVLFLSGNEKCLAAFVEYGHTLENDFLNRFFKEAPADLVKIYLERGEAISEENCTTILARKDDTISKTLLASGSWCPFPYGNSPSHPLGSHNDHPDYPEVGVVSPS